MRGDGQDVSRGRALPFVIVAACALAACGRDRGSASTSAQSAEVTFAANVAPLVYDNCAPCHHPGGAGPFPLLTYDDVRKRARQIVKVTSRRYMPPWLPDENDPPFADVRRLSDAQIATLARWVEQGTPEGDRAKQPAPPAFPDGWQLGEPDLVLRAPDAWTAPADGPDVYRNFVFHVPVASRRYVKGFEIHPGNRRVTHHANVLVDRSGWARARDAEDPAPGFAGMDLQIPSNTFDPDSHFLFWKPGTPAAWEPPDMAWKIERDTDLVLNMHIRPSGKPEVVQPTLALYFTDRAPARVPMLLQLEHDGALDIPPGSTDFVVDDTLTLPVDVDLAAIYPHAHWLGRDVQGEAVRPDGRVVPLVHIRDWDPAWQGVFRYRNPVSLPAGTTVRMRWQYDNSRGNVRNPHDPPVRVGAGDQSTDEMAHLWLQVIPRRTGDRAVLQEAAMRRRLEKYPGDFSATANLAALHQTKGRLEEAIAEYRQALRARPDVASVHNALGTALQAKGDAEGALRAFANAARLDPQNTDVHYNWGTALLALNRPREALLHFERVLQASPRDAPALNDYGTALAMLGRFGPASSALERSLAADPDNGYAHYNLARVLVRLGRTREAVPHYEAAVRIDPANHDAAEELAALRSATR
jgi:tetratricopeptide (TPR) repeat protein/mono/diheme cytochrome c family protein